jgi:cobyrinic acid a,c-diamide synthase
VKNALAVAATATGEGKTLVALAIAALLHRNGYAVQPFKCGPDYIDARLYEAACGIPARNVDLWLDGIAGVRRNVERAASRHCAVFEGMMGLFDGDESGNTSSAHVFHLLDVPVLLVIDTWRMSQSAAAIALGCTMMEPPVRIAGIVLNRVAGDSHERSVRSACERIGIPVLAALPNRIDWQIPERHLGLDPTRIERVREIVAEAAGLLQPQFDLGSFFERSTTRTGDATGTAGGPRVALACDEAFWFTYPETIAALEGAGARCVTFSPLHDDSLPPDVQALWIGGGYPELHAAELAANAAMRSSIAEAVDSGIPVYAECGGMMYLAERLETASGRFPMAGALRGETSIAQPALHIGYRSATAARDGILDRARDAVRAYEFHYATGTLDEEPAYECDGIGIGAWRRNVVASFFHRHFLEGDPAIARFLDACRA